jgi:hypothetical protein
MDLKEPAVVPTKNRDISLDQADGSVAVKVFRRATRYNTVLTIVAASVAPVLYVVYINRYAVNAFRVDDWTVVPIIHAAIHGHLSLSQLWAQYNESRLLIGNVVEVLFGFIDRLDLRSLIFFSAALFIVSYAGLLVLFRNYLGRNLTPIPVLIVGVTWFSFADVQNSLWAFQVSWYVALFFFVMMLVALLGRNAHRNLWFAGAVLLACAASLTTIQGFLCWPLGAICILWTQPWARRVRTEITVWLGTMVLTIALYLPGYHFGQGNTCAARTNCSATALLHHPGTALGFFFALMGNVIPSVAPSPETSPVHNIARFEVVGVALCIVALFIIVQSFRHRASSERMPLPLVLIVFALLFDVTITVGRGGTGASGALDGNRFVMANLILLTGIVIYAMARVPTTRLSAEKGQRRTYAQYLALFALAAFLVVQVIVATGFGLTNGRANKAEMVDLARLLSINPSVEQNTSSQCRLALDFQRVYMGAFAPRLSAAIADHLGEFRPTLYHYYRALGPGPFFPRECKLSTGVIHNETGQG